MGQLAQTGFKEVLDSILYYQSTYSCIHPCTRTNIYITLGQTNSEIRRYAFIEVRQSHKTSVVLHFSKLHLALFLYYFIIYNLYIIQLFNMFRHIHLSLNVIFCFDYFLKFFASVWVFFDHSTQNE